MRHFLEIFQHCVILFQSFFSDFLHGFIFTAMLYRLTNEKKMRFSFFAFTWLIHMGQALCLFWPKWILDDTVGTIFTQLYDANLPNSESFFEKLPENIQNKIGMKCHHMGQF